jgi:hypothetical protein
MNASHEPRETVQVAGSASAGCAFGIIVTTAVVLDGVLNDTPLSIGLTTAMGWLLVLVSVLVWMVLAAACSGAGDEPIIKGWSDKQGRVKVAPWWLILLDTICDIVCVMMLFMDQRPIAALAFLTGMVTSVALREIKARVIAGLGVCHD